MYVKTLYTNLWSGVYILYKKYAILRATAAAAQFSINFTRNDLSDPLISTIVSNVLLMFASEYISLMHT